MIEKGFPASTEFQKHLRAHPLRAHGIWARIKNYVPGHSYSKSEIDAFFEGYSGGGKGQVDASNVIGLTQGSIPFADAGGALTEDNTNFFWDATNKRLGILGVPDCTFHLNNPGATALFRVSATMRPWVHWEESANNRGFAFGIDAADQKFHMHYDSPMGTEQISMLCLDAATSRVGFFQDSPQYSVDITGTLRCTGSFLSNGTNVEIDSGTSAFFTADAHDDDAYIKFEEDNVIKWSVGFDYSDGLKFKIGEGLVGTNSHFEISPGGAIQLPDANHAIQWTADWGGGGGLQYTDSAGGPRYGLLWAGSNNVVLCSRAANGTVEIRANSATAGLGGEVTAARFEDDLITAYVGINGTDLNLSAPVNIYNLSHDLFADYVAAKHYDWTNETHDFLTTGVFALGTGTPPSSSPADRFQMYSADIVAGHAACHIRNENDTIIKLYQQAHIADAPGDTAANNAVTINAILVALENAGLLATA